MIATRLGLVISAVVAAVLALALLLDVRSTTVASGRHLLDFDVDRITALSWKDDGVEKIALTRAPDGWRILPDRVLADRATIGAVIDTLRSARWHRRASRASAGMIARTMSVTGPGGPVAIGLGASVDASTQFWIAIGDHAFLVDTWVVRALFPVPLELYIQYPFARAATAKRLQFRDVRRDVEVVIDPAHSQMTEPAKRWLAASYTRELVDKLAGIRITALATQESPTDYELRLDTQEIEVGFGRPCQPVVGTQRQHACVERHAWNVVVELFANPVTDLRVLPAEPADLQLADGKVLVLTPNPMIDGKPADADRVAELRRALGATGEIVPVPGGAPVATLKGQLELYANDVVVRVFDRVALRVSHETWQVLARPSATYRDPTRWVEDASTITSISVDGATYRRGAALGEWTGPGKVDAALLEALASALAVVRAPLVDERVVPARKLSVTFAPPVGAPSTHVLELATPTAQGCAARIDGATVRASLALCTAAFAVR